MKTEEFDKHYKAFHAAVASLEKHRILYNKYSSQFNEIVERHRVVNVQFDILKDELAEVRSHALTRHDYSLFYYYCIIYYAIIACIDDNHISSGLIFSF